MFELECNTVDFNKYIGEVMYHQWKELPMQVKENQRKLACKQQMEKAKKGPLWFRYQQVVNKDYQQRYEHFTTFLTNLQATTAWLRIKRKTMMTTKEASEIPKS